MTIEQRRPDDQQPIQPQIDALDPTELEGSIAAVTAATLAIFDADGAGVMLVDGDEALHYIGTTDERSRRFEAAQERTGEGPCIDALLEDTIVSSTDIVLDPRWPDLTHELEGTSIGGLLGVPIRLGGAPVGSLNVIRTQPWEWSDADISAVEAHARVIEELMAAAMLARDRSGVVDQLQHALENRVTIERAIGIVMARRGIDATRAFHHLRLRSRNERRPVREVAEEIVAEVGGR